ncbi:MAG TPA: CocE/NonD family hydrolase [Puia sp.]|nr:CocE/NonD family hydrolase [Puia sp.]
MKITLLFVAIFSVKQLSAQQIFFAKENYQDSASLAKTIPSLAAKVLELYKDPDKSNYLDNAFRFLMVAKKYDRAILYIDSFRKSLPPLSVSGIGGIGVQYECFSKAKIAQLKETRTFDELFKGIFATSYVQLDADGRNYISRYAIPEIPPLKKTLDALIKDRQLSDTITLENAMRLVRSYNSYISYSAMVPMMRPIVASEDRKSFIIDKVFITMRDGSRLEAETGRQRNMKGRLPTIFIFNIYIDSTADVGMVKLYASKGYACVVANTRGKGGSPQSIEPFEHDANDAYDVIDWISRQPWSNKKVGMTGGSYLGFSQWAAAKNLHRALKTIMPEVAVGIGIDYPTLGSIYMSYMLRWIHNVTNSKQTDEADFNNESHWDSTFKAWYKSGRSFRSLDTIEGRPNLIFQRWLQHPSFDSYWQNMRAYDADFSKINIPVLTTTGYFDADHNGAMYYYRQHYLHNPNANNYLVIGPYDHGGAQSYPRPELMGYKLDSVATAFNFVDLSIQWFNYVLKDSAKPILLQDKVNYEVMGANVWRHAPSLAAMTNDTLTLYLSNTRINQHYKFGESPEENEYIRQEIDFSDRTDTNAYDDDYKILDSAFDSRNSISFISQPFEQPIIVDGSFIASLKAAINKKDMDLTLSMYEQTPEGKYFSLGSSLQRASYVDDPSNRQLLEPGKKETIPVSYSYMTCKKLSKGSRLILVLGIMKGAYWQINYGTGKDVSDETIADAKEPLEIRWYADSYIKVPVWK